MEGPVEGLVRKPMKKAHSSNESDASLQVARACVPRRVHYLHAREGVKSKVLYP